MVTAPISPPPSVRILGIETSCDETAAAVVESGHLILSNLVASQIDLHAKYGGVFPEVASRQHVINIYPILEQTLQQSHLAIEDLDAIAVTRGPGLPGSLVVGVNTAKGIALATELPLIGVNHLEAHIYSAWLDDSGTDNRPEPKFPLIALIVSGGHTELVIMSGHLEYRRLGGTLDDAAGEAFDKVARLLGLSYPGGPSIEKAAENGDPAAFRFPRAWLEDSYNFSFSGLKTAVVREVLRLKDSLMQLPVPHLAASFQASVIDVLVRKTLAAAREFSAQEIIVAGGVSANVGLRETFLMQSEFPINLPPLPLCTDNAAMIAGAGYYRLIQNHTDTMNMDVLPNWPISEL